MNTAELFARYVVPNYARFPVAPARAEGLRLWDEDGKEYLDFGAGVAVDTLGHCHPAMVEAIRRQSETLIHCSNLYHIRPQAELARKLVETVVGENGKCFFCNSGAEANETLIKLARKYGHTRPAADGSPRGEILTFANSFHGRTLATLSATAQTKIHAGFEPLVEGFRYLPYNDVAALRAAVGPQTVAILLEPVQGEGGINVATSEFLRVASELCRERDMLLLFDEIQCGLGRCGQWCGWKSIEGVDDIVPDAISWAKGIGGGFPLGSVWVRSRPMGDCDAALLSDLLGPGSHGTTYGGSPLASAVGKAVLDEVERAGLCANAVGVGAHITETVKAWQHPLLRAVRGRGLMLGFELDAERIASLPACVDSGKTPAVFVVSLLMDAGLLTVPAGAAVVRFLPPLVVTRGDADRALALFRRILDQLLDSILSKS
jgi:acetylornithine/N-succinyldiaminopimelate aminotransferase